MLSVGHLLTFHTGSTPGTSKSPCFGLCCCLCPEHPPASPPSTATPSYHPSRLSTKTTSSLISLLLTKCNATFCKLPQHFAYLQLQRPCTKQRYVASTIVGAFCMLSCQFHYKLVRNNYKPHLTNGEPEALN